MTESTVDATGRTDGTGEESGARVDLASVELLALLSMGDNAATRRARTLLSLPSDGLDSPITIAGVGSLVVRKLATLEEGRLTLRGPANEIASIVLDAESWIEAIGTTGDATHVAAAIRSPEGTALFEIKPFDVWHVWPTSRAEPIAEIGAQFVSAAFESLSVARPFRGSIRVVSADDTTRTALITVTDDETWSLSTGPGGDLSSPTPTAPDPTFTTLASSLA